MMSPSNTRVLILFIFAVAGFFSWWLSRTTVPSLIPQVDKQRHYPDYYLVNFMLTTMDDNGIPRNQLAAENMYHYSDDDTASLEKPYLVIYQNETDSWEIRAERGLISEGGKAVRLQGDVFIEQVRTGSDRNLKIITSDLDIRTEEEFVVTGKPITIVGNFGVTEAVGMRADLKEHRLQLMSQVRGNYQPLYD